MIISSFKSQLWHLLYNGEQKLELAILFVLNTCLFLAYKEQSDQDGGVLVILPDRPGNLGDEAMTEP